MWIVTSSLFLVRICRQEFIIINCLNSVVRSTFFTEQVVNIWNSLPSDTVNFSSLGAFKRNQLVNFDEFLRYSLVD